jgi:hypothetical protein
MDDLNRAAIEQQLAAARPLLDLGVTAEASTDAKIEHLVAARLRLFESIAPAARAARVCAHRHQVIAEQLREARSYLRHQLARLFAPELAGTRRTLLPALDALCSFETYELLRTDQGLSAAKTRAALVLGLQALLDGAEGQRR